MDPMPLFVRTNNGSQHTWQRAKISVYLYKTLYLTFEGQTLTIYCIKEDSGQKKTFDYKFKD